MVNWPRPQRLVLFLGPALVVAVFDYLSHLRQFELFGLGINLPLELLMVLTVAFGSALVTSVIVLRLERRRRQALRLSAAMVRLGGIPAVSVAAQRRLIRRLIAHARLGMGAQAAAIYARGGRPAPLRLVTYSADGSIPVPESLPWDHPMVTEVARTRRPVLSRFLEPFGDDERHSRPMVGSMFPLRAHRKDYGVMLLLHDHSVLTAENLPTVESIGVQVAIILHNAETLQALLDRAAKGRSEAVLEERARIAREMHDSLAQMLALIGIRARTAQGLLARGDYSGATAVVASIATDADAAYDDTRDAIQDLRVGIDDGGLLDGLRAQAADFAREHAIATEFSAEPETGWAYPPSVQAQLQRVVQEALANVHKHSNATSARVRIERDATRARMIIEDNGVGLPADALASAPGPRFGIRTMSERMALVGGDLLIESRPNGGTRVVAGLPAPPVDGSAEASSDADRAIGTAARKDLSWRDFD